MNNAVLISAVLQNDSCMYIHIFFFFFNLLFHHDLSQDIEYNSLVRYSLDFYVNSAKPSRFRSSSLSFSCLFLIRCIKMTCILWTVRRLEWREGRMTFGAICTEKHPPGIRAYSTDKKKVSALLNALIFLSLIPRAQIKPEMVEKMPLHPAGTHAVTSPALCLAEIVSPLLGAVFTLSHR